MIYEFTVENFRSFGKAQTLSLIKGKEQNKPENLIGGPPGFPMAVRTAAVFGHNASGKSNLVFAVKVFVQTIRDSAINLNPGALIPEIVPHRLDPEWDGKPTRFEIVFQMKDRVFRYGFSASPLIITEEKLTEEFKSGASYKLFERKRRTGGYAANVEFFGNEFDYAAKDNVPKLTRDNALVLSSGANLNVPLLRDIYTYIVNCVSTVVLTFFGTTTALLANSLQKDNVFSSQLLNILRDAGTGIKGIRVESSPDPNANEIELARQTLISWRVTRAAEMAPYVARQDKIFFEHARTDGEKAEFLWTEESLGTQLFAQAFWLFLDAFKCGKTIFFDEFGANLHPLLAERLIELFQNPENNRNKAQLIFTTHHSQLMMPSLFRKDQIWFVEKSPKGQTELFNLADFRGEKYTRSSEAFEKNYLAGRYRGIGTFGSTLSGVPIIRGEDEAGT